MATKRTTIVATMSVVLLTIYLVQLGSSEDNLQSNISLPEDSSDLAPPSETNNDFYEKTEQEMVDNNNNKDPISDDEPISPIIENVKKEDEALSERSKYLLNLGVPLADGYSEPRYLVANSEINKVLSAIGGEANCDWDSRNRQVRMIFSEVGYGSNVKQISNAIFMAYLSNKKFFLVEEPHRPFCTEFQRTFAFAIPNDTFCGNDRATSCHGTRCYLRGMYRDQMRELQARDRRFFLGMRMLLWRMLTRLKVEVRQELDALMAGLQLKKKQDPNSVVLALHVRGTDKFTWKESVKLPPTTFVEAAKQAVGKRKLSHINLVTDDIGYSQSIINAFRESSLSHIEIFVRNYVALKQNRPDKANKITIHDANLNMLLDLKLLIIADIFVGTSSSNFGDMACDIRGGYECYDVENQKNFKWNLAKEKVT